MKKRPCSSRKRRTKEQGQKNGYVYYYDRLFLSKFKRKKRSEDYEKSPCGF
jgi:hypothetical protein